MTFVKGQVAWNKGKSCSDEWKKKISESHRGKSNPHTVEWNEKISKSNMGRTSTLIGIPRSDEVKQKISSANTGRVVFEDTRKKLSNSNKGHPGFWTGKKMSKSSCMKMAEAKRGEKSPNWKGGISFTPYCPKFNEVLKEEIRVKFNRTCFICGEKEQNSIIKLAVHHCDYNKMQGCGYRSWNLVPLCKKCHAKTNHNRWYWFNLLYNHWIMNEEINLYIGGII